MGSHGSYQQPGQVELSGGLDLLAHHGLGDYFDLFCKKPFPNTIQSSKYVRNVLSELDLQKGEGMELEQVLAQDDDEARKSYVEIHEFPMETLYEAFSLRESSLKLLPKGNCGVLNPMKRKTVPSCKEQSPKHKRQKSHNNGSHRKVTTTY